MIDLSIVMTVCNEENTLPELILRLINILKNSGLKYEILILDNGSTDGTFKICEDLRSFSNVRVYRNEVTKYYLDALRQILLEAKGGYVFYIDGDLQYQPEEVLRFYNYRYYDIVSGVKIRRRDPVLRKLESLFFHTFTGLVFFKFFKDPNTGLKLMKREVIKDIVPELKYLKYSPGTEIIYRAWRKGYDILEIGVEHKKRKYGESKISRIKNIRKVIRIQLHGLYHLWKDLVFGH